MSLSWFKYYWKHYSPENDERKNLYRMRIHSKSGFTSVVVPDESADFRKYLQRRYMQDTRDEECCRNLPTKRLLGKEIIKIMHRIEEQKELDKAAKAAKAEKEKKRAEEEMPAKRNLESKKDRQEQRKRPFGVLLQEGQKDVPLRILLQRLCPARNEEPPSVKEHWIVKKQ